MLVPDRPNGGVHQSGGSPSPANRNGSSPVLAPVSMKRRERDLLVAGRAPHAQFKGPLVRREFPPQLDQRLFRIHTAE